MRWTQLPASLRTPRTKARMLIPIIPDNCESVKASTQPSQSLRGFAPSERADRRDTGSSEPHRIRHRIGAR